jgi:RNA 2',3'-cyclic 3'-phosphodiesterase
MPVDYYLLGKRCTSLGKAMEEQQIRSFIAIELSDELKSALIQLQTKLKTRGYTFVKWVDAKGIHLTLKFLGNVPLSKVDAIAGAIAKASEKISPFQLITTELGVFPNLMRPNVFWLGVGGALDHLTALQQKIDNLLEPLGFTMEKRTFTPHLTLARIRENASLQDRQNFGTSIATMHMDSSYVINVYNVNLMRSQLLPGGAVYSPLKIVKLSTSI